MTFIRIIGKANSISQQLADLQSQGIVQSGPDIATGLPLDLIRDICSGDFDGPLPVRSGGTWDGRQS